MKVVTFVEKHIFKHSLNSKDSLPKEFYTDVTYNYDLKSLVVELGSYNIIPYHRVTNLISILSNNLINISEGTIDNFYKEFSEKTQLTLKKLENNILNGKFMNTDDTTSKYNKKIFILKLIVILKMFFIKCILTKVMFHLKKIIFFQNILDVSLEIMILHCINTEQ